MSLHVSGMERTKASSEVELAKALDTFTRAAQEAILIDGREYRLTLSFSANEITSSPEDDLFDTF